MQSASDPAIPPIEGTDDKLSDDYKLRSQAIRKCAIVSAKQGFPIFGIHDGGQCVSSDTAWLTYDKNGESTDCGDGKGALNAIDVYAVVYDGGEKSSSSLCTCMHASARMHAIVHVHVPLYEMSYFTMSFHRGKSLAEDV